MTGSGGSNPNGQCFGTDGGGVILIQTAQSLILNGTLDVSGAGANGPSVCSAGSAGSINVFTTNLYGVGSAISAGGASYNQSGEGSGGWIKIYTLQYTKFDGLLNISGGYRTFPIIA